MRSVPAAPAVPLPAGAVALRQRGRTPFRWPPSRKCGVLPLEEPPLTLGIRDGLVRIGHWAQKLDHRPILLALILVDRHGILRERVATLLASGVYAWH